MVALNLTADEYARGDEVIYFDAEQLTPDLLYDMAEEVAYFGSTALAERLEIERRDALAYEDQLYQPTFTCHELTKVALALLYATAARNWRGETARQERIEDFGDVLAEKEAPLDEEELQRVEPSGLQLVGDPDDIEASVIDGLRREIEFTYDIQAVEDVVEGDVTEGFARDD